MDISKPWVALARRIGPAIAADATRHDRDGTFVSEAYALLREHRFFSMAVPTEFGGGGASYEELCATVRELARHDGSTGLAFSMHSHLVAASVWNVKHGKPGEQLLRKVAQGQLVLLSTGASDGVDSSGEMVAVEGGFEVSGRKIFGSGSPEANLIITSARYDDGVEGTQVLHFPVPKTAPGVHVQEDWDALGMRGTGSHTLVFERVFVPNEAIALRRPAGQWHPVWSVVTTLAPPVYMSAYVGVAEAAVELARAVARGRREAPHVIDMVGELESAWFTTRTLWNATVAEVRQYAFEPDISRANAQLMAKSLLARAVVATVEKAMEVTGGAGYFRDLGLERLFRDVRGAPYHLLPEKQQLRFSGRLALGLDPITGAPL